MNSSEPAPTVRAQRPMMRSAATMSLETAVNVTRWLAPGASTGCRPPSLEYPSTLICSSLPASTT
jgi:hypothetical protein